MLTIVLYKYKYMSTYRLIDYKNKKCKESLVKTTNLSKNEKNVENENKTTHCILLVSI